jgi:hypothetical protein
VQPAPVQRQVASPEQVSVQPPSGQSTRQVLVPRHFALEPPPSASVQVLPPSQVTPESAPAVSVQVLVPTQVPIELVPRFCTQVLIAVQVDSQLEPHVPEQVVEFEQCEAQSDPQLTLQVLFLWQSKVMLLGNPASGSTPPSAPTAPPSTQLPPLAHVQVEPLHWQAPPHATAGATGVQLSARDDRAAQMTSTRLITAKLSTWRAEQDPMGSVSRRRVGVPHGTFERPCGCSGRRAPGAVAGLCGRHAVC